jgi:putative nucleotidyltransferase with HDIG domain
LGNPGFVILVGPLFFGVRAFPIFTLAAIGSLVAIVYLEVLGYVHPTIGPTTFDILIPIVILLLGATAMSWVIVRNLEKNLERLEASKAELRKNNELTLEAWAKVLEYRHRETEGHSRRVIDLSTRLARALGCSHEDIDHLRRGALLHDIGKLAVPDNVLMKPRNARSFISIQNMPKICLRGSLFSSHRFV